MSKRSISDPAEPLHQVSFSDDEDKARQTTNKPRSNSKTRKHSVSFLDLLHLPQPINPLKSRDRNRQQEIQICPLPPSIIKSADADRDVPKKSVTFASVFDSDNSELKTSDFVEPTSEQDLVTVITKDPTNDPTASTTAKTTEPYPFRTPLSATQSLPSESTFGVDTPPSHEPRKRIFHRFTHHHHRPKKLRHPLHTTDSGSTMNQSVSMSTTSTSPPTSANRKKSAATTTNNPPDSPKTGLARFKLTTVSRIIQSLGIHSHENPNNTESHSARRSSEIRRLSEPLY